jgi:hypothetical protein
MFMLLLFMYMPTMAVSWSLLLMLPSGNMQLMDRRQTGGFEVFSGDTTGALSRDVPSVCVLFWPGPLCLQRLMSWVVVCSLLHVVGSCPVRRAQMSIDLIHRQVLFWRLRSLLLCTAVEPFYHDHLQHGTMVRCKNVELDKQ